MRFSPAASARLGAHIPQNRKLTMPGTVCKQITENEKRNNLICLSFHIVY